MLSRLAPYLLLLAGTLLWAGNFIIVRATHELLPPIALTFWRWVLASLMVLPFAWRPLIAYAPAMRRHWLLLLAVAAAGTAGYPIFSYTALQFTTAVNVSLINSFTPILIPVMAFLLSRDRVTLRQVVGICISMAGVVVVISRGDLQLLLSLRFMPGDLWMLAAVLSSALWTVLLKRLTGTFPHLLMFSVTAFMGVPLVLPAYLWELSWTGGFEVTWTVVGVLLYISFAGSILTYIAWSRGTAAIGPTRTGLFVHMTTVYTVLMGVGLLGEEFLGFHAVGIVLVVAGVTIGVAMPAGRTTTGGRAPSSGADG